MSGTRYYIHFEEVDYPEKTSKIQIPKSWLEKEVKYVIELFTKAYNNANPDKMIDSLNVHLVTTDGKKIYSNDIVNIVLEDRSDYHIKFGSYNKDVSSIVNESNNDDNDKDRLRCKNYGCNQYYHEVDNTEESCYHHTGPPIFHDTMKCWSCCKDKNKAYDFETFQLIKGCAVGRHSTIVQKIAISASPNNPNNSNTTDSSLLPPQPPVVLKSISDYNASNPNASSATTSALKILTADRKSSRNTDGLTAKCQRKGCQKTFNITDNIQPHQNCTYHAGQPVFHDAIKFWSCCPEKKCYDFDEFLAVQGCQIGLHDDGVIELN